MEISIKRLRRIIESARTMPSETCNDIGVTSRIWVIAGTCGLSIHKMVRKKEMCKTVNSWREKSTDEIIDELQTKNWETV